MIRFKHRGDFNRTTSFLKRAERLNIKPLLERYARDGVDALKLATPKDSGDTANAWGYKVIFFKTGAKIYWTNDNIAGNVPVAILIQYGHGSGDGTFVEGRDYINPTMKPIFDKIAEDLWKEVNKL